MVTCCWVATRHHVWPRGRAKPLGAPLPTTAQVNTHSFVLHSKVADNIPLTTRCSASLWFWLTSYEAVCVLSFNTAASQKRERKTGECQIGKREKDIERERTYLPFAMINDRLLHSHNRLDVSTPWQGEGPSKTIQSK